MILDLGKDIPDTEKALFIAESADIMGAVTLGKNSSIWSNVSIRGDLAPISIGSDSNVQDNAVIHVNIDMPTIIGNQVTIAHGAIIHACTIGDNCLIGMGATVLDGAVISKNSLVGAGALVTPGKTFPEGSLIIGSPAKAVRTLSKEEIDGISLNAEHYIDASKKFSAAMEMHNKNNC